MKQQHPSSIRYFSLSDQITSEETLAVNQSLGTLSLLSYQDSHPVLLMQARFTPCEMSVLLPLLESYPQYCPYETLLASFDTGHTETEEDIQKWRTQLFEAQHMGIWEDIMQPVRGVLSRTRFKLRGFDLEIPAISETGYLLKYHVREHAK